MLEKGHKFPPVEFELTPEWVAEYVPAVEDGATGEDSIPPMAVAAQAIRGLLEAMPLPAGAIHTGQELEFLRPLSGLQRLALRAQVSNASVRQGLAITVVDLELRDEAGSAVMHGRSTLMAPAE